MGAKRVTADYAVPFRQVWEHLRPLCVLKQRNHALVKKKKECALVSQDHEEEEGDC